MAKIGSDFFHGNALVAACISVCASSFLLFGYDQGVMSGVVISEYWLEAMDNPSTIITATLVSIFDIGAVVGSLISAFTSEGLGRKRSLILGAVIVIIGSVLMGTCYSRAQFVVGRLVTGIGIGFITSMAPVYLSEISKATHRGWQFCAQPTTLLFGLMITYFLNYGCYFRPGGFQWRFPLLFQCIFAIYIVGMTAILPETPRWLIRHDGNEERGLIVLSKLRGKDISDSEVQREKNEILDAILLESKEEGAWTDLFRDGGIAAHKRFYLAMGIQFMEQISGINIVSYYAPTIFQESLGMDQERALFVGCFLQVFYFIVSFLTWYIIDKVGRRQLWIWNALAMAVILVLEAACVAIGNHASSIVAVILVFAFEACFAWGWMATVWIYPPEILPLKIRAKGSSLAAASDFLGNFLVVEITPPALNNIGWRTYIIFAVFNLVNAAIVWSLFPETAGQTLESMDRLFAREWEDDTPKTSLLSKLQWSAVRKANAYRRNEDLRHRINALDSGVGEVKTVPGEGEELTAIAT
ncbi:general substrate transporter [Xylariales sp. PMI_506]|nr:general substrate transporter [Xylariales sp. PMI_506]